MSLATAFLTLISAIILFLYALERFSHEIHGMGEEKLRTTLGRFTRNRFSGFALGAVFTAGVQSSSAVSAITVALVDASVLTFKQSLPVLLGANVGTTSTAWLVSFKIAGIGPACMILGLVLGWLFAKLKPYSKSIFYFGLIFFSLDLISLALGPVRKDPQLLALLATADAPIIGLLIGLAATAIVQSSSVITGLAVLLVSQGALDLQGAIAIIVGSNVGTTVTGLLASIPLCKLSKRTAIANLCFNLIGALVFLPFIPDFTKFIADFVTDPAMEVAAAHLLFNLGISAMFLPLIGPLAKLGSINLYPPNSMRCTPSQISCAKESSNQ